jgi:hypothetical protein
MSDQTCAQEMNRQFQAMQGRLKSLEKNMAATQQSLMQSLMAIQAAFSSEGMMQAVVILLANPYVMQLIMSQLGSCWSEIMKIMPLADFEEMYAKLLTQLFTQLPYSGSLISNVNAAIMLQVEAAFEEYQWLLENGGTPEEIEAARAIWQALQDQFDSVSNLFSSQNKLVLCKTASSLITVL